jgi:hypothetical protein
MQLIKQLYFQIKVKEYLKEKIGKDIEICW